MAFLFIAEPKFSIEVIARRSIRISNSNGKSKNRFQEVDDVCLYMSRFAQRSELPPNPVTSSSDTPTSELCALVELKVEAGAFELEQLLLVAPYDLHAEDGVALDEIIRRSDSVIVREAEGVPKHHSAAEVASEQMGHLWAER
mgnify:CR=1 FL=1